MEWLVNCDQGCDEGSGESGSRYLQNCFNLERVIFDLILLTRKAEGGSRIAREVPTEGCSAVAQ